MSCEGKESEARDRLSIAAVLSFPTFMPLLLVFVNGFSDEARKTRGASSPNAKQASRSVATLEGGRVWA